MSKSKLQTIKYITFFYPSQKIEIIIEDEMPVEGYSVKELIKMLKVFDKGKKIYKTYK